MKLLGALSVAFLWSAQAMDTAALEGSSSVYIALRAPTNWLRGKHPIAARKASCWTSVQS